MKAVVLVLPVILALSACAAAPPSGQGPDLCWANSLTSLVGQPAAALDRMILPAATRIIRPGEAVTMDYSATRLNVELDAGDRVVRVSCG